MTSTSFDWGPLVAWAAGNAVTLPLGAIESMDTFAVALYERNQVMNLTRVPPHEAVVRHFLDSLLVLPLIKGAAKLLDVGVGPGFPSWPLACVLPNVAVTAIDSSSKPIGFLREHPLPNLTVVEARVEEWDQREAFDFVTGRAVAPLAVQLEISAPWCRIGGTVVPFRTAKESAAAREFPSHALGLELEQTFEVGLPETGADRLFPVYRKVARTPKAFPRRWAEIKARALGT